LLAAVDVPIDNAQQGRAPNRETGGGENATVTLDAPKASYGTLLRTPSNSFSPQ
jgi:hypothetical protein